MCSPLLAGALGGSAVNSLGAGISAGGSLMTADAQIKAGQYNEAVANQNAQLVDMARKDALARANIGIQQSQIRGAQLVGAQRAGYAASGVDVNSGSPLAALANTAAMSEHEQNVIQNNAAREAFGYQVQANNIRQQGKIARAQGWQGAVGSVLGGAQTILGSGASGMQTGAGLIKGATY